MKIKCKYCNRVMQPLGKARVVCEHRDCDYYIHYSCYYIEKIDNGIEQKKLPVEQLCEDEEDE